MQSRTNQSSLKFKGEKFNLEVPDRVANTIPASEQAQLKHLTTDKHTPTFVTPSHNLPSLFIVSELGKAATLPVDLSTKSELLFLLAVIHFASTIEQLVL